MYATHTTHSDPNMLWGSINGAAGGGMPHTMYGNPRQHLQFPQDGGTMTRDIISCIRYNTLLQMYVIAWTTRMLSQMDVSALLELLFLNQSLCPGRYGPCLLGACFPVKRCVVHGSEQGSELTITARSAPMPLNLFFFSFVFIFSIFFFFPFAYYHRQPSLPSFTSISSAASNHV